MTLRVGMLARTSVDLGTDLSFDLEHQSGEDKKFKIFVRFA